MNVLEGYEKKLGQEEVLVSRLALEVVVRIVEFDRFDEVVLLPGVSTITAAIMMTAITTITIIAVTWLIALKFLIIPVRLEPQSY